ncbi:hypothetical protein BDZ97DRAFT_2072110 [Flammula alnicola]|nr:hypothetical protein BDZ97DRAFT_2072110 [Flammula alnicola]
MLSAVAARKAALAAQNQQQTLLEQPIPSGSGSSTPSSTSQTSRNGTPKRKSSSQKARSEPKKPRKLKPREKSNRRTVDDFKDQADVIVVEDSEDDDSDSAMSILEDYDKETPPQTTGGPPVKRAWSPSQPVEDSSEDDSVEDGVDGLIPLDVSSLFPGISRSRQRLEEDSEDDGVLSTFDPTPTRTCSS